jgi:uncharacterized membrane protein YeaQ/YmgE (transglycosylase-associated protein family)
LIRFQRRAACYARSTLYVDWGAGSCSGLRRLIPVWRVLGGLRRAIGVSEVKMGRVIMSILAWLALGLLAGFVGSKIVNKSGDGVLLDIVLGIVGAFVGGWLFNTFGRSGVTGLNLYSLLVAVVGSVIFLAVYHAIRRAV